MSAPSERVKRIFLEAAELAGAERDSYLARACGDDEELAGRVRSLLQADEKASSVLDSLQAPSAPAPKRDPDEQVAGFRLIEEIGEGGFGTVWLAEQEGPLRRRVALKLLKAGMDSREVVARFEAERRALALMDHPGIARVYEAGTTERGRPFFAMELVDGPPITDYCERRNLDLAECLELFVEVCRAVQHAHQKGVIHRDIKPNNVLVAEVDGRALPKVIDFGIAKALETPLTEHSMRTLDGQFVGTPASMSPEQVEGSLDVDTRADVYSLGVLLYEILTGCSPFADQIRESAGLVEMLRIVREVDPPRPSTRLAREPGSGPAPRRQLVRRLRGDLDWIVMRCLEKDRERRYDSAAVLANEIERHLAGEPVLAGPPDLSYRMAKFVRRHAAVLAVAATIVALLVAGIAVAGALARRARTAERAKAEEAENARNAEQHARNEAERARAAEQLATQEAERARDAEQMANEETERARTELAKFESIAGFMDDLFEGLDPAVARGKDRELLQILLDGAAERIEVRYGGVPEVEAHVRHSIAFAYYSLAMDHEAERQYEAALELMETHLGPDEQTTLNCCNNLGTLYLRQGRLADADVLLVRSYEGRRRKLGREHPDTVSTMGNLSALRRVQGRYEEALELLLEAEEILKAGGGRDETQIWTVSNNLAFVLERLGRKEEALERFEQLVEVQARTQGETHPNTLAAINNLAGTYQDLGRLEEAEEMLRRSLKIKRVVLTPEHPSVLIGLNNLAKAIQAQGRREEAVEILREALRLSRSSLGDEDPHTQTLAYNLGAALIDLGRNEEGAELMYESLDFFERTHGPDDRRSLGSRMTISEALLAQGRAEEAEELVRGLGDRAAEFYVSSAREPGVFTVQHGLTLLALGRYGEAIEVLTRGHERLQGTGEPTWEMRAVEGLIEACRLAGRDEEAERWSRLD